MKTLSEKAEDAKKKKSGKDKEASEVSASALHANDTLSAFVRASAILESGGDMKLWRRHEARDRATGLL